MVHSLAVKTQREHVRAKPQPLRWLDTALAPRDGPLPVAAKDVSYLCRQDKFTGHIDCVKEQHAPVVEVHVPIDLPAASATEAAQSLCEPPSQQEVECSHAEALPGISGAGTAHLHVDCGCSATGQESPTMRFATVASSHSAGARSALQATRAAARQLFGHKAWAAIQATLGVGGHAARGKNQAEASGRGAQAAHGDGSEAGLGEGDSQDLGSSSGRKCHCEIDYQHGQAESAASNGTVEASKPAGIKPVLKCQCLLPQQLTDVESESLEKGKARGNSAAAKAAREAGGALEAQLNRTTGPSADIAKNSTVDGHTRERGNTTAPLEDEHDAAATNLNATGAANPFGFLPGELRAILSREVVVSTATQRLRGTLYKVWAAVQQEERAAAEALGTAQKFLAASASEPMTGPGVEGWPRGAVAGGPQQDEKVLNAAAGVAGAGITAIVSADAPRDAFALVLADAPEVSSIPAAAAALASLAPLLPARTSAARSHVVAVGGLLGEVASAMEGLEKSDRRIARAVVEGGCDPEQFSSAHASQSHGEGRRSLAAVGIDASGEAAWTQESAARFAMHCLSKGQEIGAKQRKASHLDGSGSAVVPGQSESSGSSQSRYGPDDAEKAGLRSAHLPDVIVVRAAQLLVTLGQTMHRLRVAAARSAVIANTDEQVAQAAIGALPMPLPSFRREDGNGGRTAAPGLEGGHGSGAARSSTGALHFVNGTDAGMCAAWPTCLSMLGGAPLQGWLKDRIRQEAGFAMPPPGACVDGEQEQDGGATPGVADGHPMSPSPEVIGASLARAGSGARSSAKPAGVGQSLLSLAAQAALQKKPGQGGTSSSGKQGKKTSDSKGGGSSSAAAGWGKSGLASLQKWCDSGQPQHIGGVVSRQAAALLLTLRYHVKHASSKQQKLEVPKVGPMDVHVEKITGPAALDAETAVDRWQRAKAALAKAKRAVHDSSKATDTASEPHEDEEAALHEANRDPAAVLLQTNARLRGAAAGGSGNSVRTNRHREHTSSAVASVLDDAGSAALADAAAGVSAEHLLAQLLDGGAVLDQLDDEARAQGTTGGMRFRATRSGAALGEDATGTGDGAISVVDESAAEEGEPGEPGSTVVHFQIDMPEHPSGMLLRLPPGFLDKLVTMAGEDGGASGEDQRETSQGHAGRLHLSPEREESIRRSLASLAVRANGTLNCLCQHAGVPAVGMGPWLLYAQGDRPASNEPSTGVHAADAASLLEMAAAGAPAEPENGKGNAASKPPGQSANGTIAKTTTTKTTTTVSLRDGEDAASELDAAGWQQSDERQPADPELEADRYGLSEDPAWIRGNETANPEQDAMAVRLTASLLSPAPRGIALLAGSALLQQPVAEASARLLRDGDAVDAQLAAANCPLPEGIATPLLTFLRDEAIRSSLWPSRVPPGVKGLGTREASNETAVAATVLDDLLQKKSPVSSATMGMAFIAGDRMQLPPATEEQTARWVKEAAERWRAGLAKERTDIESTLTEVRNGGAQAAADRGVAWPFPADLVGGSSKPEGVSDAQWAMAQEASMLQAERARLEKLLAERVAKLLEGLRRAKDAADEAANEADAQAQASRKRIAAAGSSAAQAQRTLRQQLSDAAEAKAILEAGGMTDHDTAAARRCRGHDPAHPADARVIQAAKELAGAYEELAAAREAAGGEAVDGIGNDGAGASDNGDEQADASSRKHGLLAAETKVMATELAHEQAMQSCVARAAGAGGGAGDDGEDQPPPPTLASANGTSGAEAALAAAKEAGKRLKASKAALAKERRLWEEAVVRLVRPRTCLQLQSLATGAPSGLYTVFPPGEGDFQGVRVFCDMESDGGGWTLIGWGPEGSIGGPLGLSGGDEGVGEGGSPADKGSPSPLDRSRPGRVNALWLVEASAEMGISWIEAQEEDEEEGRDQDERGSGAGNATAPAMDESNDTATVTSKRNRAASAKKAAALSQAGMSQYGSTVAISIPSPGRTDLSLSPAPPKQSCSDDRGDYAVARVRCMSGTYGANSSGSEPGRGTDDSECPFPARMYTGATSLGVCSGHAYGAVLMGGGPKDACDGPLLAGEAANSQKKDSSSEQEKEKGKDSGKKSGRDDEDLRVVPDGMGIFVGVDETPGCSGVSGEDRKVHRLSHVAVWVR